MKPQLLLVTVAVLAVLTALPLAQAKGRGKGVLSTRGPCCDKCTDLCTRSLPPQCRCGDVSPTGCHPKCGDCQETTGGFQCMDMTANCQKKCTKAA
ncbi:hypothetical protein ACP70R_036442 [Stipagrostis hirtigluma subsp. patula]